jgi:hypothetical protein
MFHFIFVKHRGGAESHTAKYQTLALARDGSAEAVAITQQPTIEVPNALGNAVKRIQRGGLPVLYLGDKASEHPDARATSEGRLPRSSLSFLTPVEI